VDSRLGISKGVPITFSADGISKSQGGDVPVHATKTYWEQKQSSMHS